jgi:hypothetical protein
VLLLIADSRAGEKRCIACPEPETSSGMTPNRLQLFPDVLIGRRFLSSIKFLIGENVLFLNDAARFGVSTGTPRQITKRKPAGCGCA